MASTVSLALYSNCYSSCELQVIGCPREISSHTSETVDQKFVTLQLSSYLTMAGTSLFSAVPAGYGRVSLALVRRNGRLSISAQHMSRYYSTLLFQQTYPSNHPRKSWVNREMTTRSPKKTRSSDGKSLAEFEEAARKRKLQLSSEPVTAYSSVRHIFGEIGDKPNQDDNDVDMVANLKSEVVRI